MRLGQSITAETAEELLRLDLLPTEAVLHEKFPGLDQNEFDALASFIFNVGLGAFLRSTLRKCLDAGDMNAVTAQFKRWDKATKPDGTVITLKGLTRRREAEARLFWTGDYGKAWS